MLVLLILLAGAVMTDLMDYRIPNSFIVLGLISGFFYQLLLQGVNGLLIWFSGAMVPIVLLFPVFLVGGLGAGDIKLLAVTGGYFGFGNNLKCLALAIVVGAVISLIKMLICRNFVQRVKHLYVYIVGVRDFVFKGKLFSREDNVTAESSSIIHFSIPISVSAVMVVGGLL